MQRRNQPRQGFLLFIGNGLRCCSQAFGCSIDSNKEEAKMAVAVTSSLSKEAMAALLPYY